MKNKNIYEQLRKTYSDEEIVENFFFNEQESSSEQKVIDEEFRKLRLERLKNISPEELLLANILRIKYKMEDYFKAGNFDNQFNFSSQLKAYIKATNRNNKEIAANLDIHPTKLSRILNDKENPNIELMYRLGKHSNEEIPAHYWWKLYARQLEHMIKTDLDKKLSESNKVTNPLKMSA